jgi:hypothetical protein
MKLVCMQPALLPPASYFRLFAACDQFVFLDNVQFDKRWYTHRQQLHKYDQTKDWFTLPLKKKSRDATMIKDLEWAVDAMEKMQNEERRFMIFNIVTLVSDRMTMLAPMAFIIAQLDECLSRLQIPFPKTILSSSIDIPKHLRGQDRIIAICKKLGATEYINSPGGRGLYDTETFEKEGIKLTFLPEYVGSMDSVLERLPIENPEDIKKEILENI